MATARDSHRAFFVERARVQVDRWNVRCRGEAEVELAVGQHRRQIRELRIAHGQSRVGCCAVQAFEEWDYQRRLEVVVRAKCRREFRGGGDELFFDDES